MDDHRFDDLTRRLATGRTRRSVLKGLVGGGAALLATGAGSALAKPSPEKKVTVCHYDANTGQHVEISIAQKALASHLQQHPEDEEGACEACTPVGCQYGEWSVWSACSVECGTGTVTRSRAVLVEGSCGGVACNSSALVEQAPCTMQPCDCGPIPECQPGQCGPRFDNCGKQVGFCIDQSVTCTPGICGPLKDACGTTVGNCLDYTKTCSPTACGPLLDDCGNVVGNCEQGCACDPTPFEVACDGLCGTTASDGCNSTWTCPACPPPCQSFCCQPTSTVESEFIYVSARCGTSCSQLPGAGCTSSTQCGAGSYCAIDPNGCPTVAFCFEACRPCF